MRAQQAIELLQKLIATPSISRHEKEAADLLCNTIKTLGYNPKRLGDNVYILPEKPDEKLPYIMLNSHIDTVKPVNGWTKEPFSPTIEGDKLYGLGSNDAGASLVAMLAAYCQLSAKPQPYNLIFLATAGEEVVYEHGMRAMIPKLPTLNLVVVGEPTHMQMAIAEKGLMVVDCTATGESGHAARNEGKNALYLALDDINWFRNFQFPNASPTLGPVKMSVTMINAGTQHNVVPDSCHFVVDIRSTDLYSNLEILETIRCNIHSNAIPRSTNLKASAIPLSHPIVQRGTAIGLSTYGSPTMSDQVHIPYPSIKIGVGDSARSHTANEYILLSEITQGINTYVQLLDQLTGV